MYPIRKTILIPNVIKGHMLNLHPRHRARVSDRGQQAAQAPSINNSKIRMEAKCECSHMHKVIPVKKGTTL
jgi:hypothetical protein